jgi:transcriptional regulator with XRE-family HTH domain
MRAEATIRPVPRGLTHQSVARAFGTLLRSRRLEAKLTQYELAHLSGIDVSFLSRMERGLTQPSIGTFLHLARVLDTNPADWVQQLAQLNGIGK